MYPGLRQDGTDDARKVALVVNNVLQGRLNVIVDFVVPADAETLTIEDDRFRTGLVLTPVGSSILSAVADTLNGRLLLTVTPGSERTERLVILG